MWLRKFDGCGDRLMHPVASRNGDGHRTVESASHSDDGRLTLPPTLDRVRAENPLSLTQGGPLIPEPIMSSAGHLLPIEL